MESLSPTIVGDLPFKALNRCLHVSFIKEGFHNHWVSLGDPIPSWFMIIIQVVSNMMLVGCSSGIVICSWTLSITPKGDTPFLCIQLQLFFMCMNRENYKTSGENYNSYSYSYSPSPSSSSSSSSSPSPSLFPFFLSRCLESGICIDLLNECNSDDLLHIARSSI
jgi:hypothetical protein